MATTVSYGVSEVAKWCGVTSNAVTNYLTRDWDSVISAVGEPSAVIVAGGRETYGWPAGSRAAWRKYSKGKQQATASRRHYAGKRASEPPSLAQAVLAVRARREDEPMAS